MCECESHPRANIMAHIHVALVSERVQQAIQSPRGRAGVIAVHWFVRVTLSGQIDCQYSVFVGEERRYATPRIAGLWEPRNKDDNWALAALHDVVAKTVRCHHAMDTRLPTTVIAFSVRLFGFHVL